MLTSWQRRARAQNNFATSQSDAFAAPGFRLALGKFGLTAESEISAISEGFVLGKFSERRDSFFDGRMGRKESTAAVARDSSKPVERIDHYLGRITRAAENIDPMPIGGVFFCTAITTRQQGSINRGHGAATGQKSLQQRCSDPKPGVQNLSARHVPKILVRDLVGEHTA